MNYFISYAIKYKDISMLPITQYGNIVLDLPHEIIDNSDIKDLQELVDKHIGDELTSVILFFQKLPA